MCGTMGGSCPNGQTCGAGGPYVCGNGMCQTVGCNDVGKNCGTISNGCQNTVSCGNCKNGLTCGGGGVVNVCGCLPQTCGSQNYVCGMATDGCGNNIDCGQCPIGLTCTQHHCV
jgi:hypothetical protein